MFDVFDRDNDGAVRYFEFYQTFMAMDIDTTFDITPDEMIWWLKENLVSICAPYEAALTQEFGFVDWNASAQNYFYPTEDDENLEISPTMTIEEY
jgi:hypothetical protein